MVTLCKITDHAPVTEIMRLQQFLKSLPQYEENGFKWPKPLMDAHNLEQLRRTLSALQEQELPTPSQLMIGRVPQEMLWVCSDKTGDIVGLVKVRTMLTPALLELGGHIGYGIAQSTAGKATLLPP